MNSNEHRIFNSWLVGPLCWCYCIHAKWFWHFKQQRAQHNTSDSSLVKCELHGISFFFLSKQRVHILIWKKKLKKIFKFYKNQHSMWTGVILFRNTNGLCERFNENFKEINARFGAIVIFHSNSVRLRWGTYRR